MSRKIGWFEREQLEITGYIIFTCFMAIALPLFFGLVLGMFENSFVSGKPLEFGSYLGNYLFYYIFIVLGLVGLPALKQREMLLTNRKEHPANQKNPKLFTVGIIHDPEQDGMIYQLFHEAGFQKEKNPARFMLNPLRLFVISIIVFSILGLVQVGTGFNFTGVKENVLQQVSPAGEVYFSSEPASSGENAMLLFVFCLFLGLNGWISSKLKWGKTGYFLLAILICILMGFLWGGFHSIAYGNDDAKFWATVIFGAGGSLATLFSGSFIPWYVWHFCNNAFYKLAKVYASVSEDIFLKTVIFLVILTFIWVFVEFKVYKKNKKRKKIAIIVPE